jgi:hypothetical protein
LAHDWEKVRALGTIPQVVKQSKGKPVMSRPLSDQPDLFAQAAARPTKISDAAMAGFRDMDGAALPHPASGAAVVAPAAIAAAPTQAPRRRRAKGI